MKRGQFSAAAWLRALASQECPLISLEREVLGALIEEASENGSGILRPSEWAEAFAVRRPWLTCTLRDLVQRECIRLNLGVSYDPGVLWFYRVNPRPPREWAGRKRGRA